MNVKRAIFAKKAGQVVEEDGRLKFIVDDNFSKGEYRDKQGIIYYIVINDEIMKIGGGQGGVYGTVAPYLNGNSRGMSLRTYGVWRAMKENIAEGKIVEFYVQFIRKDLYEVECLEEKAKLQTTPDFYAVERHTVGEYLGKEGGYPPWNLQEAGAKWPDHYKKDWVSIKN